MKNKYIPALIILLISFTGCTKDFLSKVPKGELTEETAFINYDNFKTYAWGLYDVFEGYSNGAFSVSANPASNVDFLAKETYSDNMAYTAAGSESPYAYQKKVVPAKDTMWSTGFKSFGFIRRVNLMLANIDKSQMSQSEKDHWRSVGYFFKAYKYFELMSTFGDVPWVDKVLGDADTEVLYGKRTARDTVANNILELLTWAETNIKPAGDGVNTINRDVVRSLISRFGLFEGTWRKYHGLANAEKFLRASADASQKLITSYPTLMSSYDKVFNTEELAGKPGIILCKQYATSQNAHSFTRAIRTSSWYFDLCADAIQSYLCTDGKPVSTSPLYEGNKTMAQEFRKRDRRLYFTVVPPYVIKPTGAVGSSYTFAYTANAADREYIDFMKTLPENDTLSKWLPQRNWNGFVTGMTPHFRKFNVGQGFNASELGYYYWKYYNLSTPVNTLSASTTDAPIFRMGEILVNHAEAKFELGEFNQSVADQTINKLRVRAGVAAMSVAAIDGAFDPKRDATVDPVLWEIRRERRVELMGDGFRFDDLRRWKKGEYVNKQQVGVWVKNADFGNKLKIQGGGAEGYVEFFGQPQGWLDKYYLEPIPLNELALNPALGQNPGWE